MKKTIKFLFIVILIILLILAGFFFIKFNTIKVNPNITKVSEIKNLDKKVFWNFGYNKPNKISTDFSFNNNSSDTVMFNCYASKNQKLNKLELINFTVSTGYNGTSINIYKIGNKFISEIEDFDDVVKSTDFLELNKYKILEQNLTLNKSDYKIGDSIFGKIELKIKDKETKSVELAKGYFRTKME